MLNIVKGWLCCDCMVSWSSLRKGSFKLEPKEKARVGLWKRELFQHMCGVILSLQQEELRAFRNHNNLSRSCR